MCFLVELNSCRRCLVDYNPDEGSELGTVFPPADIAETQPDVEPSPLPMRQAKAEAEVVHETPLVGIGTQHAIVSVSTRGAGQRDEGEMVAAEQVLPIGTTPKSKPSLKAGPLDCAAACQTAEGDLP